MPDIEALLIRCPINTRSANDFKSLDQANGEIKIPRGVTVRMEYALFKGDTATEANLCADLSNIESIRMVARTDSLAGKTTTPPWIDKLIEAADVTDGISYENWTTGAARHFAIDLSKVETNIAIPAGNTTGEVTYFLALRAILLDGSEVFLGRSKLTIFEDGFPTVDPAPENEESAYTQSESDARYFRRSQLLSEIASGDRSTARANLGIVAGALVNKVAVPAGYDAAGVEGDFALDQAAAAVWLYSGDGVTHSWIRLAGTNAA